MPLKTEGILATMLTNYVLSISFIHSYFLRIDSNVFTANAPSES